MQIARSFLLGVGAQKAGTSWLHKYLVTSPNVAAPPLKEYHVWDARHIPCCYGFGRFPSGLKTDADRLRHHLQRSPESYFKHFTALLDASGRPVTCDITPSYAGLSAEVLGYIKTKFAEQGVSTKAVFLLRDPVERCWSAARMVSVKRHGHNEVAPEALLANIRSVPFEMRTRYDLTIQQLELAFGPGELFMGLYEKLGDSEQLRALSDFCGVETRQSFTEQQFNVTPKGAPLSPQAYAQIARHYRPVYDFVARRFPQTRELWPGYQYL